MRKPKINSELRVWFSTISSDEVKNTPVENFLKGAESIYSHTGVDDDLLELDGDVEIDYDSVFRKFPKEVDESIPQERIISESGK